ncbi:MAG: hypothetical protein ACRDKV_10120, partial [Solirubrobacterales bacterium]
PRSACLRAGPRMLELRLYRLGLLISLAAAVVVMFSVVSRPEPLRSDVAADAFDGERAAGLDRQLLEAAPEREPGSEGNAAAAEFVAERFRSIQGGSVSEQSFVAEFDGSEVRMRNVSLVLPGLTDASIVISAPRDCDGGPCAASSGAATAALLELASAFDGAPHAKTLVFVSTDGSVAGAAGAKMLAGELEDTPAEAAIVISQPGSGSGRHPFVVPWSTGPQSASIQLLESARVAVSSEVGGDPLDLRTFPGLFALAIPSGLQEEAALVERGVDAIGISSAGDRPLPSSEDGLASLDPAALGDFGRATLSLIFALDRASEPPEHGPEAYLPLAGKLIPGWALALLAIALLSPVGLVSIDGLARASRGGEPVLRTLLWTAGRSAPFLAVLVLAYLISLPGLVPDPAFPFDPRSHPFGFGPALALVALAAAFVAALIFARPLNPAPAAEEVFTPAVGFVIFVATAAIWLVNPYLALLFVPTAHLWLAAAMPELRSQTLPALLAVVLGLVIPLLAVVDLASSLGVGWSVPWQLLLMFTGGQIGLPLAIALSVLGGCLIAIVELAMRRRVRGPAQHPVARPRIGRHKGPGSLGGPPSRAVPGHKF